MALLQRSLHLQNTTGTNRARSLSHPHTQLKPGSPAAAPGPCSAVRLCAANMADLAFEGDGNKGKKIVLIGITGATGRTALQGMLTVCGPSSSGHTLAAMTRSPCGQAASLMPGGGAVELVKGDLEDISSLACALRGASAVYCHALSKDGATADPFELVRAKNLAQVAKQEGVGLVIYNSSGGRGCGYGITQMEQKHQVEDILGAHVPLVALQATLFMEELWKKYTRPGILKGTFTWSTPTDRPIQLVAARDMGLAAGHILAGNAAVAPGTALELAGDELSPAQLCQAFAEVQGFPVKHSRPPAWPFWFLSRDVFRISRFLTEYGYRADVAECRRMFPGMLTFKEFLLASGWADPQRTFEQGIVFSTAPATSNSGAQSPAAKTASRVG